MTPLSKDKKLDQSYAPHTNTTAVWDKLQCLGTLVTELGVPQFYMD